MKRIPPLPRRLIGIGTFFLPTLVTVAGVSLGRSRFRYDPMYVAWTPRVIFGSVFLAAVVPLACILTSSLSLTRRIGFAATVLCLLVVECALAFSVGLVLSTQP